MIDWELSFSTPYAQKLANGEIGSARAHAKVLTDQYIRAIKLGAPPAIPPTLPSGIPPAFPPAPVGPGTFFNLYETRRLLFENTIYTYFQAKAIINGQANIKDAVTSLKRLQKKAKQLRDEIKTTTTELKTINAEIKALPKEFIEFYQTIKSLIEQKINQIKELRIDSQDNEYVTQKKKELLQALFGPELTTFKAIINFKPTLNPADYVVILNTYTTIKQELDRLTKITSSEDEFKKFLLTEVQASIVFILSLVPGFTDPTEILTILADYASAAVNTTPLVRKAYTILVGLLKKTRYLENLKLRLQTIIVEKKKKLNHWVNVKTKKLRDWVNKELKELKKRIADYQARLNKSEYIKLVKEDIRRAKVKISKAKLRIQILRDINKQVLEIVKEVSTLMTVIKKEWLKLLGVISRIVNFENTLNVAIQSVSGSYASTVSNYADRRQIAEQKIQDLKALTPQQSAELAVNYLGQASTLFDTLLALSESTLNKGSVTERINQIIKNKINEINGEYKSILSSLLTAIIKAQTLKKLIQYDSTLKVSGADVSSIQKEYIAKITVLKQNEADQIKSDVIESTRVQKPTFKDLVLVFDELTALVDSNLKMTQQARDAETRQLELEIKKAAESNKFLKSLQKKNAKIQRLRDNVLKTEYELKQKLHLADKQKTQVQKAKLATKMGAAAGALGVSLAKGDYLISNNEQSLQKFIQSYYDYQLLDHTITKAAYDIELKSAKDKLQTFKDYELFVVLLVEVFKEIKHNNFISELQIVIQSILDGPADGSTKNALSDFLNNIVTLVESGKVTTKSIINLVEGSSFEILSMMLSVPQFVALESKYTKRIVQLIKAYQDTTNKQEITIKNQKLQEFYKDVQVSGSVLITCIKYAKKYLIDPNVEYITKLVNNQIDTIKKKHEVEIKKYKKIVDIQKQRFKDKLINVDAKVMSVMFGTAARLFWTGATWTNPVGTTFTTLTIGPFIPIKALPKDGADGMAREIGDGFSNQLAFMTGIITPNPTAAIPPFPFTGYI